VTTIAEPRLFRVPDRPGYGGARALLGCGAHQLICFPHAGGNWTAYREWPGHLPPDVEVIGIQLPGRGSQLRATPYAAMEPLVSDLCAGLRPVLRPPVSFFGHSMGALIAFETARELQRGEGLVLHRLFVSGSNAPPWRRSAQAIHRLGDQRMKQELSARYGGAMPGPALLDLLLPAIRADFSVVETYRYRPGKTLSCPIVAFGGADDLNITAEGLAAWTRHTTSRCREHRLPGRHFFLESCPEALLGLVIAELADGRQTA
jgi:medium-chain acyl-[acyl-carrier-protein] hydrolase